MPVVNGLSPQTDPAGQTLHPFSSVNVVTNSGTVEQCWITAPTMLDANGNRIPDVNASMIGSGLTGPDISSGGYIIAAGTDGTVTAELQSIFFTPPPNAASVTFAINVDWIDPNAPGASTQPWLAQQTEQDQETISFSANTIAAGGTLQPAGPPLAAPPPDASPPIAPITPSSLPGTSPPPSPPPSIAPPDGPPSGAPPISPIGPTTPTQPATGPAPPQQSLPPAPTQQTSNPSDPPGFTIADLITGTLSDPSGNSLQLTGPDDYMVQAQVPSALIVADSGPLNFITEAGGNNATFLSANAPVSWNTISGFHTGDFAFIAGVTPQTLRSVPNLGVPGMQGLTFETFQNGGAAFLTLAGVQDSSHLAVGFGNDGLLIVGT